MTIIPTPAQHHWLAAGSLRFALWNSGDLFQAASGETMLNQYLANPLDGSLNNLYLRIYDPAGIRHYPLVGIRSGSRCYCGPDYAVWEGAAGGLDYRVVLALTDRDVWFWNVNVYGNGPCIDVIYGQDIGLADSGAVRSNEAYLSQYIDHTVFEDDRKGYVVCSRQNQPQSGVFPYMQQGSLTRATGYSTDGFQFFGLSSKETGVPEILAEPRLANAVYQYEFAYTALQSETVELNGEARFLFYGLVRPDHPEAITVLEYGQLVEEARQELEAKLIRLPALLQEAQAVPPASLRPGIGKPAETLTVSPEQLEQWFPSAGRRQEEYLDGELASFFTDRYEHVVLKKKELLVERPHGHILTSGDNVELGSAVITTTSYMYGVFNSHVVTGNTNMNKMIGVARGALNLFTSSGQRIYMEHNGEFRLLAMPSLWEIGFNYVRWYYIMEEDTVVITNYTAAHNPQVSLHVRSLKGLSRRYWVTNQILMDANEYGHPARFSAAGPGEWIFRADPEAFCSTVYPELHYTLRVEGTGAEMSDECELAEGVEPGSASLAVLRLEPCPEWTLVIGGALEPGAGAPALPGTAEEEIEAYRRFMSGLMNGFRLSRDAAPVAPNGRADPLFKVNAIAWWYTHNMLVHYSVPHGLEQYGGAAWGTRDVCQGPAEYFLATGKYEQVRDILRTVYAHQYADNGDWPQWFMFDRYQTIQQAESHGDIIVWPLKVLGDYLAATGDSRILEDQVPYTERDGFGFTSFSASILDHARKELDYIRRHFLHGTHLSSYGDGDWDDTLQPANAQLKRYMVSSWTVALTYQAVAGLSRSLPAAEAAWSRELANLAEAIRRDYRTYLLETGIIPGFLYLENPDSPKPMLHPLDAETGIQYRLLPMTRSIIAELVEPEQAAANMQLVQEHFLCPDGVRLMNRPASYAGGVSRHFKRAEQAANFGREIGLQYVHAHIRYVEAMAKLGRADEVWSGLEMINPVGIREVVENAEPRQSNAYFSSSDGAFPTRYEAQERFGELRTGQIPVKGGWRIYSSGPGIYMNQLISAALGIRSRNGDLVLDPVLPADLAGISFRYAFGGRELTFRYMSLGGPLSRVVINGIEAPGIRLDNPYRTGGLLIGRHVLEELAGSGSGDTVIELYAQA